MGLPEFELTPEMMMKRFRNIQSKRGLVIGEEDRISSLPDPILHQILSPLNAVEAVRTSLLSSRWRYVWKSLPNINFEDDNQTFLQLHDFSDFMYKFISLRDGSASISSFRLHSPYPLNRNLIDTIILYAVEHNVEKIYVNAAAVNSYKLPDALFSCESLTTLELGQVNGFVPPQSLSLPSLKKLHLKLFVFFGNAGEKWHWPEAVAGFRSMNDFVFLHSRQEQYLEWDLQEKYITTEFFSGCPKLEWLILDGCMFWHLDVSIPKLKRLEILMRDVVYDLGSVKVGIDCPQLTSVKFEGCVYPVLTKVRSPCLGEIFIDLRAIEVDDRKEMQPGLINIFEHIENASSVTLSTDTVKVLARGPLSLESCYSPFPGLKSLTVLAPEETTPPVIPNRVITYLTKRSWGDSVVKISEYFKKCGLSRMHEGIIRRQEFINGVGNTELVAKFAPEYRKLGGRIRVFSRAAAVEPVNN